MNSFNPGCDLRACAGWILWESLKNLHGYPNLSYLIRTNSRDQGSQVIVINNYFMMNHSQQMVTAVTINSPRKHDPQRRSAASPVSDSTLSGSLCYCINTGGRFTGKLVLTELQVSHCWGWHGSTDLPISTGLRAQEGWEWRRGRGREEMK